MVLVNLGANDFGIVIRQQTGIQYSAQTAGGNRNHPKVEGFFVPIAKQENPDNHSPFHDDFHSAVCGVLAGKSGKNPSAEIANGVDETLRKHGYPFHVDRKMLDELQEAWIPVVIDGVIHPPFENLIQLFGMRAILVYPNCA